MAATPRVPAPLPPHLARYVVAQDYSQYTPRDQAVWRHIMRQLTRHLEHRAHPSYLRGLAAAGISVERIPSLAEMNAKLAALGWSAVAVRGFIPPAVFTELQARSVLAIAADIRSHEHIEYTPAPDIVHESAGHAPILADPRYAEYVRRCGVVGFKAIASLEDQAVYEAVRALSVVKEDPAATGEDGLRAEARLQAARAARTYVSESSRASRLYWWTAEYGLVGPLESPRIYGAGLLSSTGEAVHCLGPAVTRRPLELACVEQDFDITTMQPTLFVARDFEHLFEVLAAFEATLAWRRGGDAGLEEALRARTVNHLALTGGLELTGRVARLIQGEPADGLATRLAILEGPGQLSRGGTALGGPWQGQALVAFGAGPLPAEGPFSLSLGGDVTLTGVRAGAFGAEQLQGFHRDLPLALPAKALLLVSAALPSVAGGPGDPEAWDRWFGGTTAGFGGSGGSGGSTAGPGVEAAAESLARRRKAEALAPELAGLYTEVRTQRDSGALQPQRLQQILQDLARFPEDWLLRCEVEELLTPAGAQRAVDPP